MADDNVILLRGANFATLPPILRTPRLTLRPLFESDESDIFAYAHDVEMTRFLLWDAHRSKDDTRAFLTLVGQRYAQGEPYDWGIELDGRVVGTVGLFERQANAERAEVGYALARPHWRKGIMREALNAILDHCFCTLALRRIIARTHVDNLPSRALLRSAGFLHEGTLRQDLYAKGKYWDVAYYGLLAGEFRPLGTQIERRKKAPTRAPIAHSSRVP